MEQVKQKFTGILERMKSGKSLKTRLTELIPSSPGAANDTMSQQGDSPIERRYFRQSMLMVGGALIVMLFFFLGAFFLAIRGAERTVIPNVRELDVLDALTRLQERELYPRINIKFTGNPADKGLIIDQSPDPGLYVKAGRRVALTVSRGAVIDKVENYVGKNVDEVRKRLISLFSTFTPLLVVREPVIFVYNEAPPGTILAQTPLADTPLSDPVELILVASRGNSDIPIKIPDWTDWGTNNALQYLAERPFAFRFTSTGDTRTGTIALVTAQSPPPDTELNPGARVTLRYTPPENVPKGRKIRLLRFNLPEYPVPVLLEAIIHNPVMDQVTTFFSMAYPGGPISFPYIIPEEADMVLMVNGSEIYRE